MKIYIAAPDRTVSLPGGGTWPKEGRPIDPISPYERRLVLDGDLIEKADDLIKLTAEQPATSRASKSKET